MSPIRRARPRELAWWLAALAVTGALAAALVVAFHQPDASRRRVLGTVVGLQMYAHLDPPPRTEPIPPEGDPSDAAPGTPHGYVQAFVLDDPKLHCDVLDRPVACGAKLEIFRHKRQAVRRAARLTARSDGEESVLRKGALVLRISHSLDEARRADYASAFDDALSHIHGLAGVAQVDRA